MKLGLAIRGKWTSEHDVSQDVHNYIYTYLQNWSFKNLCHCQYFIHTWILLFLVGYFEIEYVKNDLKLYFLEIIYYMIYDLYWQYCNKEIVFSSGQLDSLQPLPTQMSRPKSIEHEFRYMTNLLNLYNLLNTINPK